MHRSTTAVSSLSRGGRGGVRAYGLSIDRTAKQPLTPRAPAYAPGIFGLEIPPRHLQVVMALKIEPELRTAAGIQAQPKRRVGRDTPPVVDDPGDPVRRNSNRLRDLAL